MEHCAIDLCGSGDIPGGGRCVGVRARGAGGAFDAGACAGSRRSPNETDLRDARALSEASCRMELPSVHIPSARSREWKAICGVHDVLTSSRTKMINNVRGWLRGQARRPRSGAASTFPERVRKLDLEIRPHIENELRLIETVSAEIRASEAKLEAMAEEDPVCARLMTVPGVGASPAVRFLAAIDQVSRFPGAHKVEAYWRELELGAAAETRHHLGALSLAAMGPGPSCVGRANELAWGGCAALAPLGQRDREVIARRYVSCTSRLG